MQDTDSQLVKLIFNFGNINFRKTLLSVLKCLSKYIFVNSFGPWCPYPYARIRMETGGVTRSEQPHDL